MKEIQTKRGVLKYRLPNVSECFEIIGLTVGEDGKPLSIFETKKKVIKIAAELADYESVGYSSRQEMIDDPENMLMPLSEIADQFYVLTINSFSKKKESLTHTTPAKRRSR